VVKKILATDGNGAWEGKEGGVKVRENGERRGQDLERRAP